MYLIYLIYVPFSVPCVSGVLNIIACGGRDQSVTISCNENEVINIKAGSYGRTVSYEEACYHTSQAMDINCVSEESGNIVSNKTNNYVDAAY